MPININTTPPPFRKLRGYAFDPSLSLKIDTAFINNIVYKIKWEHGLKPGPTGAYLEVIDYDPTVKQFYAPVNLNDPYILAQDGLDPSESNPQFHQQMVYAVAMTTIKNFEKALGRPIHWCPRIIDEEKPSEELSGNVQARKRKKYVYVPRLRIYPHAFRDANAYYSPQKKALLFGYFAARPAKSTIQMPNSQVFTCLSHDIIAHETTHAILDGIYNRYIQDTNPDVLAFHEAFADIVALFQHFTFPEVLKHQIAKTRGDLASQNLLGQLAQEFGSAIGNYGALRDAIGSIDPETKKWRPKEPDGDEYQKITEPHARGAILVSAIFEVFITIYKNRISDLLRIASGGTGILPQGELHPDLVNRLAAEASKSAGHILRMCIQALDYCPPVDITFGDYLRAIITADSDLVADDEKDYRLAFIDAFRRRGIYPEGIKSLSVESLCYNKAETSQLGPLFNVLTRFLREFSGEIIYADAASNVSDSRDIYADNPENIWLSNKNEEVKKKDGREKIFDLTKDYITGRNSGSKPLYGLHRRFYMKFEGSVEFEKLTGLIFCHNWADLGVKTSHAYNYDGPSFEVHSLKLAARVGPGGKKSNQIILSLVQNAGVEIIENEDAKSVKTFIADENFYPSSNKFMMTGGVTLIFNLDDLSLKYAISKPLIDIKLLEKYEQKIDEKRALKLYNYYSGGYPGDNAFNAYFNPGRQNFTNETFSFLHTH